MNKLICAALVVFALVAEAADDKSPKALAAENAVLVDRFGKCVVRVSYFFKRNARSEEPDLRLPYHCPNCNSTHYRDSNVSIDDAVPFELVGYVTGPDEVMIQDVSVPPEFLDRIEVMDGEKTVLAVESAYCPDANAIALKTFAPLESVKPLVFTGKPEPAKPSYFYIALDDGLLQSGVRMSNMTKFRHFVDARVSLYEGNPNTLVIDESGEPVTLAFQVKIELGKELFEPPAKWRREPAARRSERRDAFLSECAKSILPVYIQLEAPQKEKSLRRSYLFSSNDEVRGNDIETLGFCVGDKILIPLNLTPDQTARLAKIEATSPDGTNSSLKFVGSSLDEKLLVAAFDGDLPNGVKPFACDGRLSITHFNHPLHAIFAKNRGGRIQVDSAEFEAGSFTSTKGRRLHFASERSQIKGVLPKKSSNENEAYVAIVSDEGLVAIKTKSRKESGYASGRFELQGTELAEFLASPSFDLENVPRSADDRKRTPTLGVEVECASADVLREKKALSYFTGYAAETAAIVLSVAPNSPAAGLGIKEGDVLLSAKRKGGVDVDLRVERDRYAELNWEEILANENFTAVYDGELTPWADVEIGLNGTLAANFTVGSEVIVSWVSNGERREGVCRLALAPVHYQNAPKSRNQDLGMTVCDMTDEVRKYFKFDSSAPGVVIQKVKSGGVADVAGLKPLELILEVNGESVTSAKDFAQKVKGAAKLNFTVQRISKSRIVPVSL